jgi:hypothetical protein
MDGVMGMINEAKIKLMMVSHVREEGGYARRFEDKYTVGQPDMMVIPVRCPVVWAEVKIINRRTFGATQRQWIELEKLTMPPYCYGMIIGWKSGTFYAHKPTTETVVEECLAQKEGESTPDFIRRAVANV